MSFYLFLRYFLSRRSGSLIKLVSRLSLAGITVSISALLLIISVMEGFGEAIKSRLLDKQAHLTVEFENSPFLETKKKEIQIEEKSKKKSLFINNNQIDKRFFNQKQREVIKNSQVFETQEVILNLKDSFKGIIARGYYKLHWQEKKLYSIESLEPILKEPALESFSLELDKKKYVLISSDLALETGLSKGDSINILPLGGLLLPLYIPPPVKVFEVAGILPSDRDSLTSLYYQQGSMDFGDFSNIRYKAEIQLKKPGQILEHQKLFQKHKVQNWMEQNSYLFFALKLEKFIMVLFFIIALFISCLGLSSSLLLLMTQKIEDIAILQTLGVCQKDIVKIFTKIGLYLSILGIILGALIGLFIVTFLKYNDLNLLPKMYQDRTIPAVFVPVTYGVILLGTFFLAWVFCYLPSRKFSQIQITNILKSKGL
ncbi:MAG: ABC transporter permease [Bdellovibrionales bacterium]|nr:ABC transporter permease [Bdellovibrionales bacterium]